MVNSIHLHSVLPEGGFELTCNGSATICNEQSVTTVVGRADQVLDGVVQVGSGIPKNVSYNFDPLCSSPGQYSGLHPDSSVIDMRQTDSIDSWTKDGSSVDPARNTRIRGAAIDLGAYELQM